MTKFLLPVRFTYSTRVTRMPALPTINRPGSIKIFKPSGPQQRHQPPGVFLRCQNVLRRGGFPPGRRAAGEGGLVNDSQAAADAEKFEPVFSLQPFHQRQNLAHGLLKWAGLRDLRADVHLQSAQAQIFQFARAGINALDLLELNAEFVFIGAGRDFCMGVGVHARVHPHRHGRDLFEAGGDAIDAQQFRLAFHVE